MNRLKIFMILLIVLPVVAVAQNENPAAGALVNNAPPPRTYGTSSLTYLTLAQWNFVPIDSTVTFAYNITPYGIYRTNASGSNWFDVGVNLPEGARVEVVELNVCDSSNTGFFASHLTGTATNGSIISLLSSSNVTTPAETPGCVLRTITPTPFTINNAAYAYSLDVFTNIPGNGLVLIAARIGYKLQVSPAPGTATFADVSNAHPFYQYIEALAAAGITGGCTAPPNPNYCPNDPITRGQMAVFLSRALGLHWAP